MLHLFPKLVDMAKVPTHPPARFPPYDVYPVNPDWVPSSGALCSAKIATAESGALMIEEYVQGITRALSEEFGVPQAGARGRRKAAE